LNFLYNILEISVFISKIVLIMTITLVIIALLIAIFYHGKCISIINHSKATIKLFEIFESKEYKHSHCDKKAYGLMKIYCKSKGMTTDTNSVKTFIDRHYDEMLKAISKDSQDNKAILTKIPLIMVISEYGKSQKASSYYNGSSFLSGTIAITYAYFIKYIEAATRKNKDDYKKTLRLISYIIYHELSHQEFKFNTIISCYPRGCIMHHMNEYYADMKAFYRMNATIDEGAEILEYIKDNLSRSKNKMTSTHPSYTQRINMVKSGYFDNSVAKLAAHNINIEKGKKYVSEKDITYVCKQMEVFKNKHPEINIDFSLS